MLKSNQKRLSPLWMVIFITLLNMFIPLSTDLYLPALPSMGLQFHTNASIINLTLTVFFFFYGLGVLLLGPLSDKHGRKPILVWSMAFYVLATTACALAGNAYLLIFARILQGIAAGGVTSVAMAMIKDSYSGKQRESVLALTQSMAGIAPMLAPILGAWILIFFNWRVSFLVLSFIGLISFILSLLYSETLSPEDRFTGSIIGSLARLVAVCRNKSVLISVIVFSINSLAFMGYISISSYIYVNFFKLTEQQYSYFFAANALVSLLGPLAYVKLFSRTNKKRFAVYCFAACCISGILVMTVGTISPLVFLLSFIVMSLVGSLIRPFSTNIILSQHKGDSGSLSSILNTSFTLTGSAGMVLASLPFGNPVVLLGILITVTSLLSLIGWMIFMKSKIPCVGVKDI